MEKLTTDIYSFENLRRDGKEIETTYPKRLDALTKKLKTDRKGALGRLLDWYDSYWFCPDSRVRVCNPKLILGAPNHEVRGALKADYFRLSKRNIDEPLFAKPRLTISV